MCLTSAGCVKSRFGLISGCRIRLVISSRIRHKLWSFNQRLAKGASWSYICRCFVEIGCSICCSSTRCIFSRTYTWILSSNSTGRSITWTSGSNVRWRPAYRMRWHFCLCLVLSNEGTVSDRVFLIEISQTSVLLMYRFVLFWLLLVIWLSFESVLCLRGIRGLVLRIFVLWPKLLLDSFLDFFYNVLPIATRRIRPVRSIGRWSLICV